MPTETFPIDLSKLKPLKLDPKASSLTEEQKGTLKQNIQLCRDAVVFFTALAGARGLSGHTGGGVRYGPGGDDHPGVHRGRGTDPADFL